MSETKQVIVIRKDLKMRRGKEIAQGAHASLGAILSLLSKAEYGEYGFEGGELSGYIPSNVWPWLTGSFTKICVTVNSEEELLALEKKAKEGGMVFCLIKDNGTTEFGGVPTYTALAVGPDFSEEIDKITGHLPLY